MVTSTTGRSVPLSGKNTPAAQTPQRAARCDWLPPAAVALGFVSLLTPAGSSSQYAATHAEAPVTYTLRTTSLLRKYTLLGDLPWTALPFAWRIIEALAVPTYTADAKDGGRALAVNSWHRYGLTRAAFAQHPSQYTWDRHLYMIVSRYVWFNDLTRVLRMPDGPAVVV